MAKAPAAIVTMVGHLGAALLALVIGIAAGDPIVIHVSPPRDRVPEQALAVATLPQALELLGTLRAKGDASLAQIIVHDGDHQLEAPLVIDPAIAGEGLTILAAPGATPLVSGGRTIPAMQEHDDGTWRTTLENVRRGDWWFEEVFAGLTPRTRARHPNAGFARVVAAGPDNRTSFTFDPTVLPARLLDARAEVVFLHDWSTSRVGIASVSPASNTLTVANPIGCKAPHYAITNFERHPRFFVEGSSTLVDQPGEWALERDSGEFVYRPKPGERLDDLRLIAPVAPALLRIVGTRDGRVANVTVRGLRFAHVAWNIPPQGYAEGQASFHEQREQPGDTGTRVFVPAAIELSWAIGCHIDSCIVASVGGSGISLGEGCRDCRVTDSVVRDAGANGVMVGAGSAGRDTVAAGNAVRHCLVERCGRRFFGAVGVWVGLTQRTTIANCEIRELPYTGVSVGWRWDQKPTPCRENLIERNHIHDVMLMLSDGGGIYTLGRQPGTVLRGNAIHDVARNSGRAPSNGIFFDQGTMDLLVEANVIWAIDTTPLRWHMTHANTVRDNTLVLSPGQAIARYNRAKAEDIAYQDNRTPDAATWSSEEAAPILAGAGPRSRQR